MTEQHFFPDGGEVLLAVSGGRDSVALSDLMYRSGIRFALAHCNFHLRPGECDRDQQFVQQLAERLKVRFFTVDFDTSAYAVAQGYSIEEAARELRYGWFARLCNEYGYACVATAHHRDDSVETFFLNLFRGTGIAGLHGIRPNTELKIDNSELRVVRPMLCFSRADINEYIAERGLCYVEDSTNATLDARRNRIRLRLMPLLRELYPSVDTTMEANIARLADVNVVFENYTDDLRGRIIHSYESRLAYLPEEIKAIEVSDIQSINPRRTLLFELLRPFAFNAAVVDDIMNAVEMGRGGKQFFSSTHVAELHRGNILLFPLVEIKTPTLNISTLSVELCPQTRCGNGLVECFDADIPNHPLTVRPWREGDRFRPLGMTGSRLVSDFLKDSGLSLIERQYVHLLVDSDNRPLWVVGLRMDDRFRITTSTKRVLRVECLQ